MYSFYLKLKQAVILAAFVVYLGTTLLSLNAQAAGCGCSAGKPAAEQHAKHECTCHKMHQTRLQKVLGYFKGTYLRGGLEMRHYTQVARSKADVGFLWGVGYGFHTEPMRLELVMQYNTMTFRANTPALKAKARTFFINGYYDFIYESLQAKHLKPYMTVGAGQTKYYDGTFVAISSRTSKTKTAWNTGVGMKFDLSKNFAIDAGYRYVVLGKFIDTNHVKGHQGIVSMIFTL